MSKIGGLLFKKHICRTCLCKIVPSNSTSIFSDVKFYNDQTVRRALEEITYTIMDPQEKLPENVCLKCLDRLKDAISFKKSIEEADKVLRGKLKLAAINCSMGYVESEDSLLDAFCNEIHQTSIEHAIPRSTENKSCDSNDRFKIKLKPTDMKVNKRNIKIINQNNTKKKTEDLKSFSGREFIDNFLNQQDVKNKSEEKALMNNSQSLYCQPCRPVKSYSNKKKIRVKEENKKHNEVIDKILNQQNEKTEIQDQEMKVAKLSNVQHSKLAEANLNEYVLKTEEENQYILIVQDVSDSMERDTVILQASDVVEIEALNEVQELEDDVIITENVPEIIEIADSPEPPPVVVEEELDEFSAQMAWVQNNLTTLGTVCEDTKIGCKKCDKKFSIMEDKDEQDAKHKDDERSKIYTISMDKNRLPDIIPVSTKNPQLKYSYIKVAKNTKVVKTNVNNHLKVKKTPRKLEFTNVIPGGSNTFKVDKEPQLQKCKNNSLRVKEFNNDGGINNTSEVEKEETLQQEEAARPFRKRTYSSDKNCNDEELPRVKFSKKNWSPDDMIAAMEAYREKRMGYKQCSKVYGVPRSTLARYIKFGISNQRVINKNLGSKPIFSDEMEAEIVRYGMEIKRIFYVLSRIDLCKIAYDLSYVYNIHNKFNPEKKQAGMGWLNNFLARNANIIKHLSKPFSNTSNPLLAIDLMKRFLTIYKTNLDEINSNPNRLYSCYEMGFTASRKNKDIYCKTGAQLYNKIHNIMPHEKRTLITSLVCFNATEEFIPPLIVSPQKRMISTLAEGFPAGTVVKYNNDGWIQKSAFLKWLEHFINHVKPTASDPVVLIISSRGSYIKNIDTIDFAKKNNVLLTCLPPQGVYKIEPAERGQFLHQFKNFYKYEIKMWSECKNEVSTDCTGRLFANAYLQTLNNAMEGFQMSGLYPLCVKTMLTVRNTSTEDNENSNNSGRNNVKMKEEELISWIKEEPLVEEKVVFAKDAELKNAAGQFTDQSDNLCENIKLEVDTNNEVDTYIKNEPSDIEIKSESA